MDFSDFLKYVPKIKQEKLLAEEAHFKMVPVERILEVEKMKTASNNPRKAAVMMLIYPKNDKAHLALIVRNTYPGVHSAQIGFPGGKVEIEDESLTHTALRETHEEIGIHPENIEVIKTFTEVFIPPSNFIVAPFLGISYSELEFIEQVEEVSGIIEFPLLNFLNDNTVVKKIMDTSYGNNVEVPTFKINEHYVWGATAMMMSELKEVLKNSFKN
jgi:8-oxo-dGTP pyrophosphatase MutT (NUDIX family)